MASRMLDRYRPPYGPRVREQLDSFLSGLAADLTRVEELSTEQSHALAEYLLELACRCTNIGNIQLGREILFDLPRPWTVRYLEACSMSILDGDDEWEYRRLLELAQSLDKVLLRRFVEIGVQNSNPEIREAADDFRGAC